MRKKFLVSAAPLLAMAAFAVMPAMASASFPVYGSCTSKVLPQTKPPCPEKFKFTAFTTNVAQPQVISKSALTGLFQLRNEAGTAGFDCEKQGGQGVVINQEVAPGVIDGLSETWIVYEKCKGFGGFGVGGPFECGKVNETEKIIGVVSDQLNEAGEDEVTIVGGFGVSCPHLKMYLGGVTGKITGQAVPALPYETNFNKATGLTFAGEASNITGTSTSVTLAKVKIYSH
jgi:hypothetical protein